MNTDTQLLEKIATLKSDRDQRIGKMTVGELEAVNGEILALQADLNTVLTQGADPCPNCGNDPHGMRRAKDVATLGMYEVGCVFCPPTVKDNHRISISARGFSIPEAVENWNAHKWIDDYQE